MISNPAIGDRVKAVPREKRLVRHIPEAAVITEVIGTGPNASYGWLLRVQQEGSDYRQNVWANDYELVDPPDPHALFMDHYL